MASYDDGDDDDEDDENEKDAKALALAPTHIGPHTYGIYFASKHLLKIYLLLIFKQSISVYILYLFLNETQRNNITKDLKCSKLYDQIIKYCFNKVKYAVYLIRMFLTHFTFFKY